MMRRTATGKAKNGMTCSHFRRQLCAIAGCLSLTGAGRKAPAPFHARSTTRPRWAAPFGEMAVQRQLDPHRHAVEERPLFSAHRTAGVRRKPAVADRDLGPLNWADSDRWPNGRNGQDSGRTRAAREGLVSARSGHRPKPRQNVAMGGERTSPRHSHVFLARSVYLRQLGGKGFTLIAAIGDTTKTRIRQPTICTRPIGNIGFLAIARKSSGSAERSK